MTKSSAANYQRENKMLGIYVKDKLTGFEGYINGIVFWDTGNVQYSVKPQCLDGKMQESHWVDGNFLEKHAAGDYPALKISTKYEFSFNNGDEIKSFKSTARGIISGQVRWINGCNQYWVTGGKLNRDNKVSTYWMDETELILVREKKINRETRPTGGPDRCSQQSTTSG